MASRHHEDEVFAQKRRPKNPIKFKITLNDEQKEATTKKTIYDVLEFCFSQIK